MRHPQLHKNKLFKNSHKLNLSHEYSYPNTTGNQINPFAFETSLPKPIKYSHQDVKTGTWYAYYYKNPKLTVTGPAPPPCLLPLYGY